MPGSRRYSEQEVNKILRLATTDTHDADGMTLDEIVAVATEAGLDANRIRAAAERLDLQHPYSGKRWLLGCEPYTEVVQSVPGELHENNWDEVVAELRSAFRGPTGSTSRLGKTSEWYGGGELTAIQVALTPEGNSTRVKARLTAWAVPLFSYGLIGFLTVAASLAKLSKEGQAMGHVSPQSILLAFTVLVGVFGVTRFLIGGWYKNKLRQMHTAVDGVRRILDRQYVPLIGNQELVEETPASSSLEFHT